MKKGQTLKIKSGDLPPIPNPWGITTRVATMIDAFVRTGDHNETIERFGVTHAAASVAVAGGLARVPGECRLHKLIHWRDFRGLVPRLEDRTNRPIPFGLTPRQARLMDLVSAGIDYQIIADRVGMQKRSIYNAISRCCEKIPGDHNGQSIGAWRRARESQE